MTANGVVGPYAVTASIPGMTETVTFALSNVKADTTTVITSWPNPSGVGQEVVFTVTVSSVPPGVVTPTGTVELYEVTSPGGLSGAPRRAVASQPLDQGTATFATSSLLGGRAHELLALYSGDESCNASTSALYTQDVEAFRLHLLPIFKDW